MLAITQSQNRTNNTHLTMKVTIYVSIPYMLQYGNYIHRTYPTAIDSNSFTLSASIYVLGVIKRVSHCAMFVYSCNTFEAILMEETHKHSDLWTCKVCTSIRQNYKHMPTQNGSFTLQCFSCSQPAVLGASRRDGIFEYFCVTPSSLGKQMEVEGHLYWRVK